MKPIVLTERERCVWRIRIMLARSNYIIEKAMREMRIEYPWMFR